MLIRSVFSLLLVLQAATGNGASCQKDRLVSVKGSSADEYEKVCRPDSFLVEAANNECAQVSQAILIAQSKFQCATKEKTPESMEIEYMCCNPSDYRKQTHDHAANAHRQLTMAESIVKEYVVVARRFAEALEKKDVETAKIILENEMSELRGRLTRVRDLLTVQTDDLLENHPIEGRRYISRQAVIDHTKRYLFATTSERLAQLTLFIARRVVEGDGAQTIREVEQFDVENQRNRIRTMAFSTFFPNSEKILEDYYLDLLKNTTIGFNANELEFLAQPRAHKKLIDMYVKVLNEDKLKFIVHKESSSVIAFLALTITSLAGVAFGISTAYGFLLKKRGMKTSNVVYKIFDDGIYTN